jgi:hypothetical protein
MYLSRIFSLEVKGSYGRDETECIIVSFERNLGARVDVRQIEESKQLVFRRRLVICQVRRTQNEPAFLPRLRVKTSGMQQLK